MLLASVLCSWINHYVLIRADYGSVCRTLCKYYFSPTFALYTFNLCWASSSKSERESQPKSANVLW